MIDDATLSSEKNDLKTLYKKATALTLACTLGLGTVIQQAAWAATTPGVPPVPSPTGGSQPVGTLAGKAQVNDMGALVYDMPFAVPPGTAQMTPQVGLAYDSQAGDGLVGLGWMLTGLMAITRCPRMPVPDGVRGTIENTNNDGFCLDDTRLIAIAGPNGGDGTAYRTEKETFAHITSHGQAGTGPAWFEVRTKDGKIMEFGNTSDSRIEVVGQSTVRVWAVNTIRDRSTNYERVIYGRDRNKGAWWPLRIDYTGNERRSLQPYNSVQYSYGDRPDVTSLYQAGAPVTFTKRLTGMSAWMGTTLVRDLRLTYEAPGTSWHSRLQQVTSCDGQGVCLPPTSMHWSADTAPNLKAMPDPKLTASGNWSSYIFQPADTRSNGQVDLIGISARPNGLDVVLFAGQPDGTFGAKYHFLNTTWDWTRASFHTTDVNMDQIPDIVVTETHDHGIDVSIWYGRGNGEFSPRMSPINEGLNRGSGYKRHVIDVTDDGAPDIVLSAMTSAGFTVYVYENRGDGTFLPRELVLFDNTGDWSAFTLQIADSNGDSVPDFIAVRANSSGYRAYTWLGLGDGTFGPRARVIEEVSDFSYYTTQVGDFNNDGVPDLLVTKTRDGHPFHGHLFPGLGDGRFGPRTRVINEAAGSWSGYTVYAVDMDGDGSTDIVALKATDLLQRATLYRGRGNGEFEPPQYLLNKAGNGRRQIPLFIDVNRDGKMDLLLISPGSTDLRATLYQTQGGANRIEAITNGLGERMEVTYRPLTDPAVHTRSAGASWPVVDVYTPHYVVTRLAKSDGIGGTMGTTYQYEGAKAHQSGRGFLGFAAIERLEEETGITTRQEFLQEHPYTGLPARTTIMAPTGIILSDAVRTHRSIETAPGVGFVYADTIVTTGATLDGTPVPAVTVLNESVDHYGNFAQVTSTTGAYTKTQTTTFLNDTGAWLLGLPLRVVTTTSVPGDTRTKTVAFSYDPATGLPVRTITEPDDPALRFQTDNVLDAHGNTIQSTVSTMHSPPRTTRMTYDPQGRFPLTLTNPAGHTETRLYDARFGTVAQVTGPNGETATVERDGFGRIIAQIHPDGTKTALAYRMCDASCGDPLGISYVLRMPLTASGALNGPLSWMVHDQRDRLVLAATQGFDGGTIVTQAVLYDDKGHVIRAARPYRAGQTPVWTLFENDLLGHAVKEIRPDGGVITTARSGLTSTVTDEGGGVTTVTLNDQGKPTLIVDADDNELHLFYDADGTLIRSVDPLGIEQTRVFDLLARQIASSDPDRGTVRTAWNDALGATVTHTDAKGQVTTTSNDLLGRPVERTEADRITRWTWDTCLYGKGKLCAVETDNGYRRVHTYYANGKPKGTMVNIDGVTYTTTLTYHSVTGRLDRVSDPGGLQIKHLYTATGYVSELRDAITGTRYIRILDVDAEGHLLKHSFANGVTTVQTYDAATGLLLTQLAQAYDPVSGLLRPQQPAGGPSNAVHAMRYRYDVEGRLAWRQDQATGLEEDFTYDPRDQMTGFTTKVNGATLPPVRLLYDVTGKPLVRSDVGIYEYTPAHPHTPVAITNGPGAAVMRYDASGQQTHFTPTTGPVRTQVWTAGGQLASVVRGNVSYRFAYGPEDQRFKQDGPDGLTHYVHPDNAGGLNYERVFKSDGTVEHRHYLMAGSRIMALLTETVKGTAKSLKTRYAQTDHLGSPVAWTDEGGMVVERLSFSPFGEQRFPSGAPDAAHMLAGQVTDRGFTGHEHLSGTGIIHMNGRVFAPGTGLFLSPDRYVQAPGNLLSWNPYIYGLNDPMMHTDPSGQLFGSFFRSIRRAVSRLWRNDLFRSALSIAAVTVTGPGGILSLGTGWQAVVARGFLGGVITGGVEGGIQGAFTAVAFNVAGHNTAVLKAFGGHKVLTHAVAGCASALVAGQDCARGALVAGIAESATPLYEKMGRDPLAQAFAHAVIGGGTAALSGGKFTEGAVLGAYGYVFNNLGDLLTGHHWYESGVNELCDAAAGCTASLVKEAFSHFRVPGQDGLITGDGTYPVHFMGIPVGDVYTEFSASGLTNTNTTLPGHIFYKGQIQRHVFLAADNHWYVRTVGSGHNLAPSWTKALPYTHLLRSNATWAAINQISGPMIFNSLDQDMRKYIQHQLR